MKNSYNIWIPSIQKFKRFSELTIKHGLYLYKSSILSESDFIYSLNHLLQELLIDKSIDINKLTIIDKYVICVYLKMICSGTQVNYTLTCPECNENTTGSLNLNDLILPIKDIIDRKYEKTISSDVYDFTVNMPTLAKEQSVLDWYAEKDLSQYDNTNIPLNRTMRAVLHVSDISIGGISLNFSKLSVEDQITIIQKIPFFHISKIEQQHINHITKNLIDTEAFACPCKTEGCNYISHSKMNTINDILRFILISSPEEYFAQVSFLSHNYNMPPEYISGHTQSDLKILLDYLKKPAKKETTETHHPEFDKFDDQL